MGFQKPPGNPSASMPGPGPRPGGPPPGGAPGPAQLPQGGGIPSMAVLVFLKSLASPIVLYADDPQALYEEMKGIIKKANTASPKLVERPGMGPLRKVSFIDTQIAGVALQVDPSAAAAGR